MLASAVRWREDTGDSWCVKVLAGNIYDTAERWSGRHEALSNRIGVLYVFSLLEVNFF